VEEAQKKRPEIIRRWQKGEGVRDIARTLGVCEPAVMNIVVLFEVERVSNEPREKDVDRLLKEMYECSKDDDNYKM